MANTDRAITFPSLLNPSIRVRVNIFVSVDVVVFLLREILLGTFLNLKLEFDK
eukprot:CAMPEP_0204835246 /NCGR_PEP_ID=MMETSP1346-20131115/21996_1 /ASSEMBLY_ACC=CAM_ASM_000771 /TAXON_ID=215587 /ORGANISM="Aplanochytrium stocchinoi, Strain GSBS06" /LENGTH=52 /DNA_ID=CAMNT_0051969069 /DNA_START=507 /DNA_END=665 /DNA_ORIENTATION=-